MTDVVPGLQEKINAELKKRIAADKELLRLAKLAESGQATYEDAAAYAARRSEMLSQVLQDVVTEDALPDGTMYYNIADRILTDSMTENYEAIADVCEQTQAGLNKAADIGIQPVRPELNEDRIDGLADMAASAETYDEAIKVFGDPVVNAGQSVVDDSVEANAKEHQKAGLKPKIVRKSSGKCCKWCQSLAGVYSYSPTMDRTVFRRHKNCDCTVSYDPGDGKGKMQDAHSKKWDDAFDYSDMQSKSIGMGSLSEKLGKHEKAVTDLLENAPKPIQDAWNNSVNDINIRDAELSSKEIAAYKPWTDGIYLNLEDDKNGNPPYETFFHESGHNIDFAAGRRGTQNKLSAKPLSATYGGGSLTAAIDKDLQDNLNKYALQNGRVNKKGDPVITKKTKLEWCQSVKEQYGRIAVSDLSDMIEQPIGINTPMGAGHTLKYYKLSSKDRLLETDEQWAAKQADYAHTKRSTEAFAEMFSASVSNPDSLAVIQQYLPTAYDEFLKIIEEINK